MTVYVCEQINNKRYFQIFKKMLIGLRKRITTMYDNVNLSVIESQQNIMLLLNDNPKPLLFDFQGVRNTSHNECIHEQVSSRITSYKSQQ